MMDEFREEINEIDGEIFSLLKRRMQISKEVGAYKKKNNLEVKDQVREDGLIEEMIGETGFDEEFVRGFYEFVFKESYKLQD